MSLNLFHAAGETTNMATPPASPAASPAVSPPATAAATPPASPPASPAPAPTSPLALKRTVSFGSSVKVMNGSRKNPTESKRSLNDATYGRSGADNVRSGSWLCPEGFDPEDLLDVDPEDVGVDVARGDGTGCCVMQ